MNANPYFDMITRVPSGIKVVFLLLLGMYLIRFVDGVLLSNRWSKSYGIRPRATNKLPAVVMSHVVHGNRRHLFANSLPYLVLGSIIALSELSAFWVATAVIIVVGGFGTWLFGSAGSHLGSSGFITGYFGFLLTRGFFAHNADEVLVALVIAVLYFGVFRMAFGRSAGISNVMHFFGFVGGVAGAWIWSLVLAAN